MTFTSANMEIDDLLTKKEAILSKTANIISEAVMDRVKKGKINENTITADITTAVNKFPMEDREVILLKVIAKVSGTVQAQSGKSSSRSRDEEDYFSDIFGDRRR